MDAAAELGRNPVSKHQIQPEYGDEQADAVFVFLGFEAIAAFRSVALSLL